MVIFTAILLEFAWRYSKDKPVKQIRSLHPWASCTRRRRERKARKAAAASDSFDPMTSNETIDGAGIHGTQGERNVRLMLIGLCVSTFFIFVRSVYRCVRSFAGWSHLTPTSLRLTVPPPTPHQVPRTSFGLERTDNRKPDTVRRSRRSHDSRLARHPQYASPGLVPASQGVAGGGCCHSIDSWPLVRDRQDVAPFTVICFTQAPRALPKLVKSSLNPCFLLNVFCYVHALCRLV